MATKNERDRERKGDREKRQLKKERKRCWELQIECGNIERDRIENERDREKERGT